MNNKAVKWGSKNYKLQVYLPARLKTALDSYIADQALYDSRVTSALVRKALTEFLERAGYLNR